MKAKLFFAIAVAVAVLAMTASARGDVPSLISYQGRLTNTVGVPLDTTLNLVFTLYADSAGITSLWSETQPSVSVADGLFQVLLGSVNPIGSGVFSGEKRWLKVQIEGGATIAAPIPIVSVAYAYHAAKSDTSGYALSSSSGESGWTDGGATIRLTNSDDNVGIGTSMPNGKLEVTNTNSSGVAAFVRNANSENDNAALMVQTMGGAPAISAYSDGSHGLYAKSINKCGVYSTGPQGIYAISRTNGNHGILGDTAYGAFGMNDAARKYGFLGGSSCGALGKDSTTGNYGLLGSSDYGVFGKDSVNGVWGALGAASAGVYGEAGEYGIGVYGYNSGDDGIGIKGECTDGQGMLGKGTVAVEGVSAVNGNYGRLGTTWHGASGVDESTGNAGYLGNDECGVFGVYHDSANYGLLGGIGYGVRGTSSHGIGVEAVVDNGTALSARRNLIGGYAGRFKGPVEIDCDNECDTSVLRVTGKAVFSRNDGELVLRTPAQGHPSRYRLKFDNNALGVICGSDIENQIFAFMAGWGAARTNDALLRIHGSAATSWGTYIQLSHDGTDGYVTTDVGDIVMSPALNVGVGTSTPGYKLDVAGSCHATSFPTSSDVRLKTNITPLTDALAKLSKIRGVAFDWNETYDSLGRSSGHRELGVIAQEVEEQFPELVSKWSDREYRAVDYGRLMAVLIEAIKELKAENENLQKRIEALEKR